MMTKRPSRLQSYLHRQLDPSAWPGAGLSPLNKCVLIIICLGIVAAVAESEPAIRDLSPFFFLCLNAVFCILFTVEYVVRLWSLGASQRYRGVTGRFRYALTLPSIVDLLVIIGLWLDLFLGLQSLYGTMLRLLRVLRILTLTRNSNWAIAIRLMRRAILSRRFELTLSAVFAAAILLLSATVLFVVEGDGQPDAFGSIPRALWWAIATLTTVGYGDVYPVSVIGKICAGVSALTSIAIVALPTGIMAASFSDVLQELRHTGPKAVKTND